MQIPYKSDDFSLVNLNTSYIKIPFTKMHGLGNDFVMINGDHLENDIFSKYNLQQIDIVNLVQKISKYNTGIGCDQFIIYRGINVDVNADDCSKVAMYIYNQDGSKAQACGNASRCIALMMFDKYQASKITIEVNGGLNNKLHDELHSELCTNLDSGLSNKLNTRSLHCEYHSKNDISVNMGEVLFHADWMPTKNKLWSFANTHNIEPKELLCVDVANPHIVIFNDKLNKQDHKIIGEKLQNSELFKNGVNVNFATIDQNGDIVLKTWERGVGFTLACGSGACASFMAANKLGFVEDNARVQFALGTLNMKKITYKSKEEVIMRGAAEYICSGDYYYKND